MMNISMTSRSRNPLIPLGRHSQFVAAIFVAGFIAGCATEPPPLPPNNAAEPQLRSSTRTPQNLLAQNETTLAIERQLSATQAYAEGAEKMEHDMENMPGMRNRRMQHEGMEMEGQSQMQHGKMHDHEAMQQQKDAESEKKAMADEMKETSEQMKQTSEALKQKTEELKTAKTIYTCPMHPQVRSDKPGNCPICGMKLVPKKEGAHEGH